MVEAVYTRMRSVLSSIKNSRPLPLAKKILYGHLTENGLKGGENQEFLYLHPDRVAMQDATAQMALMQFILADKTETAVPTTIHCDHLILAEKGEAADMKKTWKDHQEVYDFLSSAAKKYGIGFWKPGAGIIHQVILENYSFPGGLMIGTDSHTPNAGGLGMLAIGVGGADAVDVMAGLPWEIKQPKILGVHLKGKLQGWASPKDVILKICGLLTVKGGTNKIVEYFGEGCESISCTGKATITNMGAELGATCSVFPFDYRMSNYLKATQRDAIIPLAEKNKDLLTADPEVLSNPQEHYDEVIEIDLSSLEPHIVGPHTPDRARPLSEFKKEIQKENWPVKLSAALIGSCTNSSYEDISRATHLAKQALAHDIQMNQPFLVSPGSVQIKKTIERDGQMKTLESAGALVLSNACGPCIGQWNRSGEGGENVIVSSFNRNFKGRNDGNVETLSFIASPEVVMALGLAGKLDFDPQSDSIKTNNGQFQFTAPEGKELPVGGFVSDETVYQGGEPDGNEVVQVSKTSERLQILTPFKERKISDFQSMKILCKVQGKCTTDHISPAGRWLRYRGHLDKISDNLLLGAQNIFTSQAGYGVNFLSSSGSQTAPEEKLSQIARFYQNHSQPWAIVADENYGEGSSREHAAMTPRYLGASVVLCKSFARIHETNLKKQAVLPLTFVNPDDYDKIEQSDSLYIKHIERIRPKEELSVSVCHEDDTSEEVKVCHSLNEEQIHWFWKGSALNALRGS